MSTFEIPTSAEHPSNEEKARLLAQQGVYEDILSALTGPENPTLLAEETQRLQNDPWTKEALREAFPNLSSHDWEMLTILELYDRDTFEHCVRTYAAARQKLDRSQPVGRYLQERLSEEGLTPWDVELACLFHDIGKIVLAPKDLILNNPLSDSEWRALFLADCEKNAGSPGEKEQRLSTYNAQLGGRTRPKDITPMELGLTQDEKDLLIKHGFDPKKPLGEHLGRHQDASLDIVKRYYSREPFLALVGNHHEKPLAPDEKYPTGQSAVRLSSLVSVLRLADRFDAYQSERKYKKGHSLLSTLAFLILEARAGALDPELTRLWVSQEFEHLQDEITVHDREDTTALEEIETYLHSS